MYVHVCTYAWLNGTSLRLSLRLYKISLICTSLCRHVYNVNVRTYAWAAWHELADCFEILQDLVDSHQFL
jgi:hypothetical protein